MAAIKSEWWPRSDWNWWPRSSESAPSATRARASMVMPLWVAVFAINLKQLDRFRDRFSPAGAKDDRTRRPRVGLFLAHRPSLLPPRGSAGPGRRGIARVVLHGLRNSRASGSASPTASVIGLSLARDILLGRVA